MNTSLHQRNRRPPAYMLVELMVVLMLLIGFSVILTELFTISMKAHTGSLRRDTLIHRIDAAVAGMRRDVWSANAITTTDSTLEISDPHGQRIVWTWTDAGEAGSGGEAMGQGILTRRQVPNRATTAPPTTQVESPTRAPAADFTLTQMPEMHFASHGPLVTLSIKAVAGFGGVRGGDAGEQRDEQVEFISQILVAQGGTK